MAISCPKHVSQHGKAKKHELKFVVKGNNVSEIVRTALNDRLIAVSQSPDSCQSIV